MNTLNACEPNQSALSNSPVRRLFGAAVLLLGSIALATPVLAQNTLENVSYQVEPGGKVALSLHFAGAAPEATAFTTEDPPRIVLDFANTTNAVAQHTIDIGSGSTSGVSVAEGNGRTRVVVDLFRPSSYRVQRQGNLLVLDVANGMLDHATAAAASSVDPTKQAPAATAISDIDFRRSDDGGGRIIIQFNGPGATADLRTGDGEVNVHLGNVDLPDSLSKRLDVTDFATPVRNIETRPTSGGADMHITTAGPVEASAFQTGSKYVVMVSPKAASEETKKPELGPDGLPKPVYTGEPVTFNFQDIPVRQVLHLIATQSNFNVVVADSVSGRVTLRLQNVPWEQALDIVLRAKSLDKRQQDNVIWVAPQDEIAAYEQAIAEARVKREQNAPLTTAYIPISYGNAADIAKLLTEGSMQGGGGGGDATQGGQSRGFLSPRGSVSFDQRTNTLLLIDTAEKVREIRALVATLDKPVEQVLIESRIVIASDDYARELGVKFGVSGGYEDDHGNVITTSGDLNATDSMIANALLNRYNGGTSLPVGTPALPSRLNVNLPTSTTAGSFGLAILGADYLLDLELSAAQTEGKSEIISSPRVITANQQPALISQGQEIGYQTVTSAGGGGAQLPQVQFKDVTLKLEVTPTITADKRVFLDLNVSKDSLAGFYDGATGRIPIIDTREIQTKVLVDNGATVVLGGILEVNKTDSLTKVPVLGDIPVLGTLFRSTNKTTNHAELLVFVTPRILAEQFH